MSASFSSPEYSLVCVLCAAGYTEKQTVARCLKCSGALDVVYKNSSARRAGRGGLNPCDYKNAFDFLREARLLPCNGSKRVSLGEGGTPLLHAKVLGKRYAMRSLFLKYEGANPTGVFKDRGSAVEITKALELGAKAVTCASTGNMAASVAAYCAKAKLPCYVVIPEKTPLGKLAQAIAYGAKVIKVRGNYGDCVRLSVEMARHYGFYLAGDYAFRVEGQKTIAYELFCQLEKTAPDWVIVPVGCGTNLSAIHKGFEELKALGLIQKLPRLVGVQPKNVPTIVNAWNGKREHFVPVKDAASVASAVAIGAPLDDVKVLRALYESRGCAHSVSEEEILKSQHDLGLSESLFVEPSAALSTAVLPALIAKKIIKPSETVVAVITGSGLKDPQSILRTNVDSPVLEPTMIELKRYFSVGLTRVQRAVSMPGEKDRILWNAVPPKNILKKEIKKLFSVRLSVMAFETFYSLLQSFQEKDRTLRKGDVEYALENILKMPEGMKPKLHIQDFSVHATQHQPAEAWVALLFGKEFIASRAKGVGPVDAILSAVRDALKTKDKIGAQLTYYNVEINTSGTDAVVEVKLSLRAEDGHEVTGEAASPDVIVASIKAFENAYNLLEWKVSNKH